MKSIKDAIGLAIGLSIGFAMVRFIKEKTLEWGANDEEFMEWERENNLKQYEMLKKYQK